MSQADVAFAGKTRGEAAVVDPRLKESLALWARGRRVGDLVLRSSIAIESLKTAIGSMGIVEVRDGGSQDNRFLYRLYGLALAEATGEYTGRWSEEIDPPAFARLVTAQYDETVRARVPLLHTVIASFEGGMASYERLTVPLSTGSDSVGQLWMTTAGITSFARKLWGRRPYFAA